MWRHFLLILFQGLFYVRCSVYSVSEANHVKSMMCVKAEHKTASLYRRGGTKGTVKEAGTTQVNQLSTDESKAFQICRKKYYF